MPRPRVQSKEIITRPSPAPRKSSGSGRLRDDLKRFTRERIVAAALKSFAQYGFRDSTVERIVELAGTTAPTFYRHFPSKNALIEPLQQRVADEVSKIFLKLDLIAEPDFPTMRKWLDEFAAMWSRMHRLCIAYWEATDAAPGTSQAAIPSALITVNRLTNLLGRCPADRRRTAELRLALIIPLLDRALLVCNAAGDADLKAELMDQFAMMLVASLDGLFTVANQ